MNRTLDAAAAEKIAAIFTEVIIAPDADEAAQAAVARKKNLRLLLTGGLPDPAAPGLAFRSVSGGFLAQTRDNGRVAPHALKVVTQRAPTDAELADLLFAFRVCKHVKSNAIVYAKDRRDGRHRRRAAEPGRQRPHRRLEERRGREGGRTLMRRLREAAWSRRTRSFRSPTGWRRRWRRERRR